MGIGVAVAFNTDGAINFAGNEISKTVFEAMLDLQGMDERATARATRMGQFGPRISSIRQGRMEEAMAEERWGTGGWSPDTAELQEFVGEFEAENWISTIDIRMENGALRSWTHDLSRYLVPVSADIFAAFADGSYPPEQITILRNAEGEIIGLNWDDDVFEKTGSN